MGCAGVDVGLGLCALAPSGEEAGNQHISSTECFSQALYIYKMSNG